MSTRERFLHKMTRSDFVRGAYSVLRRIPGVGAGVRKIVQSAIPRGMKLWIQVPQGLAKNFWMYVDPRFDLGYTNGDYEPWIQDLLKSELRPGDCYYDVGAHTGFFSIIAARFVGPTGQIVAFEPDPANAAGLRANIAKNGITQIAVIEAAVWSSPGEVTFERASDASNRTQGHVTSMMDSRLAHISVPAVRLDDIVFEARNPAPHLIKMDVEGAEWGALQGASRLLSEVRPKLLCEVHDPSQMGQIRAYLERFGYAAEEWQPVHPHYSDYRQLYIWAVPSQPKATVQRGGATLDSRCDASFSRSLLNGFGRILAPIHFRGKGRLANWMGGMASRFTAGADCYPIPGARVNVSVNDRIGRLMWMGCYEMDLIALLKHVLEPGMKFVDVGAQIGYFSIVAAALVGHGGAVYSFEPDPDCFSRLAANSRAYPWVTAHNCAVTDCTGEITFYRSPIRSESGWGTIFKQDGKRAQLSVRACTLDSWKSAAGIEEINFLKLDVEGAECRVLKGAQALIARARPMIWAEANEVCLSRDGASVSSLLQHLAGYGYVAQELWDRRSKAFENIVAIPGERADLFEKVGRAKLVLRPVQAGILNK